MLHYTNYLSIGIGSEQLYRIRYLPREAVVGEVFSVCVPKFIYIRRIVVPKSIVYLAFVLRSTSAKSLAII